MDAKDVVTVWMYLRDMLVVYVSIILTHETGSTYLRRLFKLHELFKPNHYNYKYGLYSA